MSSIPSGSRTSSGFRDFWLVMAGMVLLRLAVGLVPLPKGLIFPASLLVSILFVGAPIYALFRGASVRWSWPLALALLVGGLAAWRGASLLLGGLKTQPLLAGLVLAVGQQALVVWCLAIGAMIALVIREKNLLLPVAVFLGLFDLWLVFAPMGMVNQSLSRGGADLKALAFQVPAPQTVSAGGYAMPLAYVGPADFLFLSMFFVALFRFDMRVRETFRLAVPVLGIYLLVVLLAGDLQIGPIRLGALPALVPIGGVVLYANRKEFQLTKDERYATLAIALLGSAFVTWSIVAPRPTRPAELSQSGADSAEKAPAPTPSPDDPDPTPSGAPRAPENTQGLQ